MVMRSWSVSIGQFAGIHLRLHLAFLFLLVFVWLTQSASGADPRLTLPRSVAFTLVVFGSVIVREAARLLAARGSQTMPRAIILMPVGGLWVNELTPGENPEASDADWHRELHRALVGPAMNLALAGLSAALALFLAPQAHLLQAPGVDIHNLPRSAVWVNLVLAGLNLLPAYPLDGGRVLRSILAARMDGDAATRRAVGVGNLLAMLLMFAGLWDYWFMLAGFFLFIATQMEERTILFQSVLESVHMEEVMLTDFSTLSPADTLEDALSKAVHTLQDDFPVVRGTDMVGVVTRQKILRALRGSGNAYVQSIMEQAFEVAGRKDSLATAFRKITRLGLTIIPVVDQERLVGIVTLQNLMHSMGVLAESRKLKRNQDEDDGLL